MKIDCSLCMRVWFVCLLVYLFLYRSIFGLFFLLSERFSSISPSPPSRSGLTESFWLGGSDSAVEGDWVWLADGTRIDKGTPYWALSYGVFGELRRRAPPFLYSVVSFLLLLIVRNIYPCSFIFSFASRAFSSVFLPEYLARHSF